MSAAKVTAELARDGSRLDIIVGGRGNVIDSDVVAGIDRALDQHAGHPQLRLIRFAGAGDRFSTGASVDEHRPSHVHSMLTRFHGLFRRLARIAVPTLAAVRGHCLGGGLELAAWCTWVFAAPDARFGQPEIKLGVFPPLASVLLPWRIGGGGALDLCVSGRSIDADAARRIGLVHTIAADPLAASDTFFAEQLAPLSPSSLRFAERAARLGLMRRIDADLPAVERMYLDELMRTVDAVEGIDAFLDKRAPVWHGSQS
ncbi:MAG TPA: enoyl-CoA hydratase/isomerase family protein [Kofleriaceae bacterium]|jgi:cyclohexa-1,5-dienecarbonyl-CoA hydratase|nr:enoyl-CoA hydratase/isomerase family protein [Kofleriaceae bacterium]